MPGRRAREALGPFLGAAGLPRWLRTKDDREAARAAQEMLAEHRRQSLEEGGFWADRIKAVRDAPLERLRLALANLPLPAAFTEAAKSLRPMIRQKRRAKAAWADELEALYWLAAAHSLWQPYSEKLAGPGYGVMELLPGERVCEVEVDYARLGYLHLVLLGSDDRRLLVEAWGEPRGHGTLNAQEQGLWQEYELKAVEEKRAQMEALMRRFDF